MCRAKASRARQDAAGIFTGMARRKPLWVQPTMVRARGPAAGVLHHAVDEPAELAVETVLVAEEVPQDPGEARAAARPVGEDGLAAGQAEEEPLVGVRAEEQGALLRAGRNYVGDREGNGAEEPGRAVRVRAPDSGDALRVVSTVQEALHGLRDALPAEAAQPRGELRLVACEELGEVGAEQPLKRASSPLAVGARGLRIQGQRELVCHALIDDPLLRAA